MLARVVTDKRWYAIDVYETRGKTLVKIFTKGPFTTTPNSADEVLRTTRDENPTRTVVGHVFDAQLQRWLRWQ